VGGAERSARKKRQAQAAARGKPAVAQRKRADRKPVIIGAVVVVLLLAAVLGGVIYTNSKKNATEGQDISTSQLDDAASGAADDEATYPVVREGAVVVVGEETAKVTLDAYEDFLCPVCGTFEKTFAGDIEHFVKAGDLRVRYHMLPMLNERSDPPGYSLDSAGAALCAADAGKFPAYHQALYAAQPEEGARGWDKQQLAKLGADLGIDAASFKSCVESGKYDKDIQAHFDEVRDTEYLQQEINGQKGFGTPTVANGQKVVDTANGEWLDELMGNAS
jgi:protein-disulfide isomerase